MLQGGSDAAPSIEDIAHCSLKTKGGEMHRKVTKFLSLFLSAAMMAGAQKGD